MERPIRLNGRRAAAIGTALADAAAEMLGIADPEPPPEWWAPLFARRQRRLRARVLRKLEDGEHTTAMMTQRCTGYDEPEIEHALCTLAAEGLVIADRRRSPIRHGGAERREWTYWRLA